MKASRATYTLWHLQRLLMVSEGKHSFSYSEGSPSKQLLGYKLHLFAPHLYLLIFLLIFHEEVVVMFWRRSFQFVWSIGSAITSRVALLFLLQSSARFCWCLVYECLVFIFLMKTTQSLHWILFFFHSLSKMINNEFCSFYCKKITRLHNWCHRIGTREDFASPNVCSKRLPNLARQISKLVTHLHFSQGGKFKK